ncbi:e3 ubiquitin-protein ligase MIB1-like protein [Aphelenchoides avenae]|nr:e3 ubiquitin-protein ligase MIB1-like protein [Aphelenchus avenae]
MRLILEAAKENEINEIMERRIRCSVCMDHEKNTVFVCGHGYCKGCASEWGKCTVCVTEKGNRPITFNHPLFLSCN